MPLIDFDGSTFVAFIDICGFKRLMKDRDLGLHALNRFYNIGFNAIVDSQGALAGVFVSDCGIIFSTNVSDRLNGLNQLLIAIRLINSHMLSHRFLLTNSIAFGEFKTQHRIEIPGVGKASIYGNAYVNAFTDNEIGKPTIQPGNCRILRDGLPKEIEQIFNNAKMETNELKLIKLHQRDKTHYHYYWNLNSLSELRDFDKRYQDSYELQYAGMIRAFRGERNI